MQDRASWQLEYVCVCLCLAKPMLHRVRPAVVCPTHHTSYTHCIPRSDRHDKTQGHIADKKKRIPANRKIRQKMRRVRPSVGSSWLPNLTHIFFFPFPCAALDFSPNNSFLFTRAAFRVCVVLLRRNSRRPGLRRRSPHPSPFSKRV